MGLNLGLLRRFASTFTATGHWKSEGSKVSVAMSMKNNVKSSD